jgi:hypothetical protein
MVSVIHKYKDKDPNEDVMKAFRYFDEDGTGKISVSLFQDLSPPIFHRGLAYPERCTLGLSSDPCDMHTTSILQSAEMMDRLRNDGLP